MCSLVNDCFDVEGGSTHKHRLHARAQVCVPGKASPLCGEQVVTDVQHTVRLQELNNCNVLLCLICMTTCAASSGAF